MKVTYGPQASADLADIWMYVALQSGEPSANSLFDSLKATIHRTLAVFPNSGRARPEIGAGVRSIPVVPYIVVYRVDHGRVLVGRILHGRRDIQPPLISFLIAG